MTPSAKALTAKSQRVFRLSRAELLWLQECWAELPNRGAQAHLWGDATLPSLLRVTRGCAAALGSNYPTLCPEELVLKGHRPLEPPLMGGCEAGADCVGYRY